jgi:hypothetical protein
MMVQMRDHIEGHNGSSTGRPLSCEEFQAGMSELVGDGIREHPHLQTCDRCRALLEELEYIAGIARELLPIYEPGDSVWEKINASLSKPSDESPKLNGHLKEPPQPRAKPLSRP